MVGTVTDPSDLAIVGASVTLTQVGTGAQRQVQTNERGDFFFSTVQAGEYSLMVESPGFKTLMQEGINLSAAERLAGLLPGTRFVLSRAKDKLEPWIRQALHGSLLINQRTGGCIA